VHAPPTIRGGLGAQLLSLVFGLFLCACGVVAFLESRLGLPPWDVLHQGVAKQTPLSFGSAYLVVSVLVLLTAWLLGARIGIGTILNAVLIGTFVIALTQIGWVTSLADASLPARLSLMFAALLLFGVGSGFYISADLGAGPRDSLMLVIALRAHIRIGVARTVLELSVLVLGFVLGGTVGVGTVVFALGIGPVVELAFWLLGRSPLAMPPVASAA
jgi:uncharacterized protein